MKSIETHARAFLPLNISAVGSVLHEIYVNFARGTKQHHKYLQRWDVTPLHLAAEKSGAYHLIMENVVDKNPLNMISDEMSCKCRKRGKMHSFCEVTPLHLAAKNGHLSICKLITEIFLDKIQLLCRW